MDMDMSKLSLSNLMLWGLTNLWKDRKEGGYAIQHGTQPVSNFGRPQQGEVGEWNPDRANLFEQAFPCLFPYGEGGVEADRPVQVSFLEHIRWALQYHNHQFHIHSSIPFYACGIMLRRQALLSARIQMRRRNFEADAYVIASITEEDMRKATDEETRNEPISSPAVRLLKKHIHATGGRVMGSDQNCLSLRSKIWSTSIYVSPPSLWITINPSDLDDPIAQLLLGEEIDLDAFMAMAGPDKAQWAKNIASDPYAAAQFFHFLIKVILETLLGVEVTDFKVKTKMGIFGHVNSYIGTVESQGRGTLHFHLLVWLRDAPSADEMRVLLRTKEFCQKVSAYIEVNMYGHLPGMSTAEEVFAIPCEKELAYSRPPNPDNPGFKEAASDLECQLAWAKQVHSCEEGCCLQWNKHRVCKCKRRAPWDTSDHTWIDEDRHWCPHRLFAYFNCWSPTVMICT
jgi:hypothetical protein